MPTNAALRPGLAVVLAVLNGLISSPPHTPAKNDQSLSKAGRESIFLRIAGPTLTIVQLLLCAGSLCETLTPAALATNHQLRQTLLKYLLFTPASSVNLRLTRLGALGAAVGIFGCLLRYQSFQTLGSFFTFQLAIRKSHALVTSGPYRFVRHPSYTGSILASLGTATFFLSEGGYLRESGALKTVLGAACVGIWISWKLFLSYNLITRTKVEDKFLEAEFGDEWVEWSKRVQYKLFPGLY
ncbi:ICMT-domain-containing protein [Favolaschia claudopus]|uniref:Protein-S-isoprenylcysteine O-methyltransferase n=1 Tax=Favolaschia claudopus TaxID=2862362 RepID=A0AAW0BTJ8_9AGAR